jgi:hypothetical protein
VIGYQVPSRAGSAHRPAGPRWPPYPLFAAKR